MIPTTCSFVGRSLRKGVSPSGFKGGGRIEFGAWIKKNGA